MACMRLRQCLDLQHAPHGRAGPSVLPQAAQRWPVRSSQRCPLGSLAAALAAAHPHENVKGGNNFDGQQGYGDRKCDDLLMRACMQTCNCAKLAALLTLGARMSTASRSRAAISGCLFAAWTCCDAALLLLWGCASRLSVTAALRSAACPAGRCRLVTVIGAVWT
jgi:hypothetical protein